MGIINIGNFGFKGEEPHIFKDKKRSKMVGFADSVLDTKFLSYEVRKYLEQIITGENIFINEDALDYLVGTKDGLEIIKYFLACNVRAYVNWNNESNEKNAYVLSNGSANVFGIREDNYLSLDLYSPVKLKERIEIYNNLIDFLSKKTYQMDGSPVYGLSGEIMGYTPLYGGMYYQEKMQDEIRLKEYKKLKNILIDEEENFKDVKTSYDILKKYFGVDESFYSKESIVLPDDVLSRTLIKKTKNVRVYNSIQDI